MLLLKIVALLLGLVSAYSVYFAAQDYRGTLTTAHSKKLFLAFEFDQAIAKSNEASRISPMDADTYLNQGYIQGTLWIFRKEDSYKKAMDQAYTTAQTLNPLNASYHYLQARMYYEGQDPKQAIHHINKALSLDPYAGAYLFEKGTYLEAQGLKKEALGFYQQAYKLVPNTTILQAIQSLGGQP